MSEQDILASARKVVRIEAEALQALEASLGAPLIAAVQSVLQAKGRVILAGVGKSGHVARKIAATLASTGTPAYYVHPTEASHGDLGMISGSDVVIALSNSGETKELNDLIGYTRRFGIPLIAVTAQDQSTLGKAADTCLTIPPAPEACAETSAPTTSTTLMIALGDALAVAVLEKRGFTGEDFKKFHPGGKLGALLLSVGDLMHTGEDCPVIASGTPMETALSVMSEKGFGCLGVTEPGGELIGMVTDGDIRRLVANGRMATTIDDAMTRKPVIATPDMLASRALNVMNEKRISQLFVLESGAPVGVVHMHDFLKAGVA